jgi:hypothetical protein
MSISRFATSVVISGSIRRLDSRVVLHERGELPGRAGLRDGGFGVVMATHATFRKKRYVRAWSSGRSRATPSRSSRARTVWRGWRRGGTRLLVPADSTALARPIIDPMPSDAAVACRDADTIVYPPLGMAGFHIAERLRVPAVLASLVPLTGTTAFPAI